MLYQHLLAAVGRHASIRSVTISFVAPVAVGPVTLQAEVLRRGKSAVQAEARMMQDGQVVAVLLASFGAARDSSIIVAAHPAPLIKPPEQGIVLPYIAGMTPEFTRHFNLHWSEGSIPFSGVDHADMAGWMRFSQESSVCTAAHLLALVDAWPPTVLQMFKTVAPISTLSWTLEFLADSSTHLSMDWWQYHALTDAAADGYAHIQARICDKNGQLVALSRQTVAVFA